MKHTNGGLSFKFGSTTSLSAVAFIFFAIVQSGCNKSEPKDGASAAPPVPPPASTPVAQAAPDFTTVQQQVFVPHCYQCHSGSSPFSGVNLETYQNVSRNLGRIENEAVVTDQMPPPQAGGPLPQELQDLLDRWVKAGAPQTTSRTAVFESGSNSDEMPLD
jgi:uncharacterized membrane protein